MTDLDHLFDSLRDVATYGSQLMSKNRRFSEPINFFVASPFRNGLQYRNSNFKKIE